jgi:IPT/TIG domain
MHKNLKRFLIMPTAASVMFWMSAAPSKAQEVTTGTAAPTATNSVVLFESRPFETSTTAEQHFESTMNLKQSQDQMPLFLSVFNGPEGKRPFNWFRINIGGYLMASEKDLNGTRAATLDVSGKMQPGGGQILIDAAGEPGATLIFTLRTPAVSISEIEPTTALIGKKIIITGQNFSSDERQDTVLVDGKPVPILSAGANTITAMIPPNIPAGNTAVKVIVDSVESGTLPLSVKLRPVPVLTSTDFWMAPPGATLTISGQNFANDASRNRVYFGKKQVQVTSSSANTLTVIVPNWIFGPGQLNIPVYVVSDGVRSANAIPFDIGPKYLANLPPNPGDSDSEAGSEASTQAGSQASSQATTQASSQATVQSSSEATNGSYQEGPQLRFYNYQW